METEQKIPEIRFADFTKEWEDQALGNIVDITMGQSPSGSNYTDNPTDYILVQGNADIENGRVRPRLWTTQITKTAKKGDIIFSVRAPVGDIAKTDYDIVIGRGVSAIRGNEFIYQTLCRAKVLGYWQQFSAGSTFESINSNVLMNTRFMLPSTLEQDKIGNFFKNLDDLIENHQTQLTKLKNLKKAMLTKMFPQGDATVPEIRFKGFEGEWDKKKLNQITTYDSSSLSVNDALSEGKFQLYDANKVIGYTNDKPQSSEYISIIKDGSGVGRVRLLPENTSFIATMGAIKSTDIDIYFLFCLLVNKEISSHITGATIPHIYYSVYGEDIYLIPEKTEQKKIGDYFKNLDNLISNHQEQLKKLDNIKKACLNKLFVS